MAIILPFLTALIILIFFRRMKQFHLGWFVLFIPALLFILFCRKIPTVANGKTYMYETNWIPSFDINFITSLDGLSLIFGLLITGIGTLVVLYSIYYLSTDQSLVHFYIY